MSIRFWEDWHDLRPVNHDESWEHPDDASFRNQCLPEGRTFFDFPKRVRKLVYEYLELDAGLVDLNYSNLKVK